MSSSGGGAGLKRPRQTDAGASTASNTAATLYGDLPFPMAPPSLRPLLQHLQRVDASLSQELQRRISYVVRRSYAQTDRFPGPLPASVGRAQLRRIPQEDFWVTEKSDGERKLLFADHRGVFLVDRKWTIEKVESPSLQQVFGTSRETLIDGELMTPPETQASFLAYDAVVVYGHDVSKQPFGERLRAIDSICRNYAKLCEAVDVREHPFRIEQKFFVRQREIHRILSKISRHSKLGHRYVDITRRRANKNDGLIFVAENDSFRPERTLSLLKWKWPDKITIDLKIRKPFYDRNGQLELLAGSYHKQDIVIRRLPVDQTTRDKVEAWSKGLDALVVECWYDSSCGTWTLCNPRFDKQHANFITTVISTMEIIADNITASELQRVCASSPA